MDKDKTSAYVDEHFDKEFMDPLFKFVEIPNLSPGFDPENKHVDEAIDMVVAFCEE